MLDDLQTLIREFDWRIFVAPGSAEQFFINLLILAIFAGCAIVVWKALSRLF